MELMSVGINALRDKCTWDQCYKSPGVKPHGRNGPRMEPPINHHGLVPRGIDRGVNASRDQYPVGSVPL